MANLSCSTDHMDQIQTLRGLTSSDDQEERSNCITDLVSFAKGCEEKINCLLDALGWSDGVQEGTQLVPCPFDPGHRVPTTSLERHSKSCRLHTLGYSREDKAQMVDTTFFYEGKNVTAVNIVIAHLQLISSDIVGDITTHISTSSYFPLPSFAPTKDQCLQSQIIEDAKKNCLQDNDLQKSRYVLREGDFSSHPVEVPETLDREMCTLTRADRIAIYDHVVLQAKKENPGAEGSDDLYVDLTSKLKRDKTEPKEKSNLEVLAEMRDYKRRRQSYRAKNVHITRRSHTEIIREVIAVHTAELARIWKGDDDDEEEVKVKEDEEEEEREGDRSLSHDQQSGYSERRTVRQWGAEQEKRDVSRRSTERSHENEEIEKQRRRGSYGDGAKQYIGGSSREKKIEKYRTRERDDRIARHGSPGKHRNRSRSRSRESHRDRRRRSRDRDRRSNRDRRDRD